MELNGRPDPPMEANEKETLTGWLDFQRATLRWKCDELTSEQLGLPAAEPSTITLHGLIRHLTEVEVGWFVGSFTDEPVEYAYSSDERPDADWTDLDPARYADDLRRYDEAVEKARAIVAGLNPGDLGTYEGRPITLRWVLVHMIEEYARHNGHADFLRERIDGATGA